VERQGISIPHAGSLIPPLLDTSVVVRYLTYDPPDMAVRAAAIIEGASVVGVSTVVLAEAAYVLRSVYRVSRLMIVDGLVDLLCRQNVAPHGLERQLVIDALRLCRASGRVSIPDALLWAEARSSGANAVYSFDELFPSDGIDVLREGRP
jgi:predicted nucleic acid-binding protein